MEAGTRAMFSSWMSCHYHNGNIPCIEKIAQWLKDHGGFFPNPWPTRGHNIPGHGDEGIHFTSWTPGLAMTQAKGIMDELWDAREALTDDDEMDLEEWFDDHRRFVRGAPENRDEPRAGNGHRSASKSRSPVRDRADSYKDMYLREANLNVTLRSENALLHADIVRLKSLATDDRTSANLSN